MGDLVLSLFPGLGLLDRAFEEEGLRPFAVAWAAGCFDGEGCVSLAKAKQHGGPTYYYRVDLIVSNTDRALLEPFVGLFGGRIDHHRRKAPRRDCYQWKTTGSAHAATIIQELRPWLIVKAPQAEVALKAAALLTRQGGRRPDSETKALDGLKSEMHLLNQRGCDA